MQNNSNKKEEFFGSDQVNSYLKHSMKSKNIYRYRYIDVDIYIYMCVNIYIHTFISLSLSIYR